MPWLLLIPGIALGVIASIRLRWVCRKYRHTESTSGLTGFDAARKILDTNHLGDIPIMEIPGYLTDHYDLLKKRLCLSSEIYRSRSIVALGIAAHEVGHALQHRDGHTPLKVRVRVVRLAGFTLPLSIVFVVLGFLNTAAAPVLYLTGTALFALATVFQLALLPVEIDASRRAKEQLLRLRLVTESESIKIAEVLNATAMTYVAGLVDFSGFFSVRSWR